MKAIEIVNRLKEVLPKYTEDFNTSISISSLTKSGSTITCTTATAHGLLTNDYITIRGAKEPISLTLITFVDNVATATSSTDNKLIKPSQFSKSYVEITSANFDYNGTFELLEVINSTTFKFILKTIPTTTATGTLLLSDFDGYNGYKQITKINDTQFSYSNSATLQSPAQGTMKMLTATRVDFVANIDRLKADYEKTENAINQNWLYVIMGNDETYNNDTTSLDITGQIRENQDFRLNTIQQFNIYVVVPTKNSILAGIESDTARAYIIPILKSIGNYRFPSLFKDNKYQPIIYLGSGEEDYLSTYYIHRFSFSCIGLIQVSDTIDINEGVPLNSIDGNINLSFTANLR